MERIAMSMLVIASTVALVGGLSTDESVATETEPARVDAVLADVTRSATDLDQMFTGPDVPDSLAMAWSDLHEDMISIVRDLERDPNSADGMAFLARVNSFWSAHAPDGDLGPEMPGWGELVTTYRQFVEQTSLRVESDQGTR